jgi:hypothetical protein
MTRCSKTRVRRRAFRPADCSNSSPSMLPTQSMLPLAGGTFPSPTPRLVLQESEWSTCGCACHVLRPGGRKSGDQGHYITQRLTLQSTPQNTALLAFALAFVLYVPGTAPASWSYLCILGSLLVNISFQSALGEASG